MNLTVQTITSEVARYYQVDESDIYSRTRRGDCIKLKYTCIHFIKAHTIMTLSAIGREFPGINGYLDHATVMHALRSVSDRYDTDKTYRAEINELSSIFEAMKDDVREYEDEVFQQSDFFTI